MNDRSVRNARFRAMFVAELDATRARLAALSLSDPGATVAFADALHPFIGSTAAVDLSELGVLCRYCEQRLRRLGREGLPPSDAPSVLKIIPILNDVSEALRGGSTPDLRDITALSVELAPDPGP
jgi:hypothetical protein